MSRITQQEPDRALLDPGAVGGQIYGQERNLITSSIARMNLFLHGVEDFEIIRGDTQAEISVNGGILSIPLYVKRMTAAGATKGTGEVASLHAAWAEWQSEGRAFWQQMDELIETLDGLTGQP